MDHLDKSTRIAKITPPRIRKVYPRSRLFQRLQEGQNLAAVWISAPAGSGKTTLVADYLANQNLNSLWFQLDAGDADPATFFHYLGQAAKNITPHRDRQMPHLTPGHLSGLPAFTRHYFETLYLRLKPPAVLVFDHFQELPREAPLQTLFSEALAMIPEGVQVLFISRNKPPVWFAPLCAQQTATLIGWEELRLTEDETLGITSLFESSNPHRHSEQVIRNLHRQTRGWAAGLILMLQAIENEDVDIDAVTGCARETIFNYFASELFNKADQEEQIFLLKSALLPGMSLPAVTEFTNHNHADAIFRHLYKRNYFITHRGGRNPVYEYHPLFREFLLARGIATWTPSQLKGIRYQAAQALLISQQPEGAIELLLLAAEWTEATGAILKQAPTLLSQGRLHTLGVWLERLPRDATARSAWLLYWQGVCQTNQDPLKAGQFFAAAFPLFEAEKNVTGMYLTIADALQLAWITQRDYQGIDSWLAHFEKLFPAQQIPSREIEVKVVSSVLMGMYFRQPDHPLADQILSRAETLWRLPLESHLRWQLGSAIGFYISGRKDLASWSKVLRAYEPTGNIGGGASAEQLQLLMSIAFIDCFTGAYASSMEHVEKARLLAENSGVHLFDLLLLATGAYNKLIQAKLADADKYLEDMRTILSAQAPNHHTAHYRLLLNWRALVIREYANAVDHAKSALELAISIGSVYPIARCQHGLALALFASGEHEEALHLLDQARIPWGDSRHQQLAYDCDFSEAWFQLQMGDEHAAISLLRSALKQGKSQGWGLPVWSFPDWIEPLLIFALERDVETEHVQRIIQQAGVIPRNPDNVPDNWPMPIKIHTLGSFSLQINGKPLPCSALTKNRPLELLKAIIAFGGQDVAQEKIMDALWPDASGDTALKSLHTTLHRLRKLLDIEESVILKDGYLALDARYVWVDIRCLELVLDQIGRELDSQSPTPETITRLTGAAEKLFQGPFLDSEASRSWSIVPAERIRNRLIRTIMRLGHFWESHCDWERAAGCYRCGLELDPLTEEFYRHLMQAYFKQGNNAAALATYERCRKVLASTLGIMPGQETARLYQMIVANSVNLPSLTDGSNQ